jgi:hypothetical protein
MHNNNIGNQNNYNYNYNMINAHHNSNYNNNNNIIRTSSGPISDLNKSYHSVQSLTAKPNQN